MHKVHRQTDGQTEIQDLHTSCQSQKFLIFSKLTLLHSYESLNDNFTYIFGHNVEASEWPPNTLAAYFIKLTTSGEPMVASRSNWHTHFWRNKL